MKTILRLLRNSLRRRTGAPQPPGVTLVLDPAKLARPELGEPSRRRVLYGASRVFVVRL
jgi:hypothetical protein